MRGLGRVPMGPGQVPAAQVSQQVIQGPDTHATCSTITP